MSSIRVKVWRVYVACIGFPLFGYGLGVLIGYGWGAS